MKFPISGKPLVAVLATLAVLFSLNACVHQVVVNVNAITDKSAVQPGKHYFMVNANNDSTASELYFQEFRTYFDHLLTANGYLKVDDRKDADIEIRFHYGVSDGQTGIQHYSWPIYETFGGDTVRITERITDAGGNTQTINRTVYIPAYVRQVGSANEAQSYTFYNRYMNLAAFPVNATSTDTTSPTPLWNVNIYSVGESNDLRSIMPFMAAASAPYLGKNSGQQQSVTLAYDDPLVLELRNLIKQ